VCSLSAAVSLSYDPIIAGEESELTYAFTLSADIQV